MAKKVIYDTPIGMYLYPWLHVPAKWSDSARDGAGGSVQADRLDPSASYSTKMVFDPKTFEESKFKKDIDALWELTQKEYKGKFTEQKEPYWKDDDGNYVLTARRNAAYIKDGKVNTMQPRMDDCDGKNITKFIVEEDIAIGSESTGRLFLTVYIPEPKKKNDKPATLRINFDISRVQFKKLVRYEAGKASDPIEGGEPVMDDNDSIPF